MRSLSRCGYLRPAPHHQLALLGAEMREHAAILHRRARHSRMAEPPAHRNAIPAHRKRRPDRNGEEKIVGKTRMDPRRVRRHCGLGVRRRPRGRIAHLHQRRPILRCIAARRQHRRDRLAHVAHFAHGERRPLRCPIGAALARRQLGPDRPHEWRNILPAHHARDTRHRERARGLDPLDPRRRVRAPHQRQVERSGQVDIVEEAAAAQNKRPVLGWGRGGRPDRGTPRTCSRGPRRRLIHRGARPSAASAARHRSRSSSH